MTAAADTARVSNRRNTPRMRQPRQLVIDTSYSLETIRDCRLEQTVFCRDLDGYFEHVWTLHPFATLVTSDAWSSRYGTPQSYTMSPRHTFIEGRFGLTRWLRHVSPLNFLLAQLWLVVWLVRLVRANSISVIRANGPLYAGLLGWLVARLCGIPVVIRVGENSDEIYKATGRPIYPRLFRTRRAEKVVERWVLSRVDLVAAANLNYLEFAVANGTPRERTTVFPYGNRVHPDHFVAPEERPDGSLDLAELGVADQPFLMYIGRLVERKHPGDVIRVLAEVRARGDDVRAVMVGDGSQREELMGLAAELGVAEHVVFCGNRPQDWLVRVTPRAGVVVSPITGAALVEAALAAAPIAAYDVDWQSELIETDVTGELVPFRDHERLADATARLLADREYAARMGRAVREKALARLDPRQLNAHERSQYELLAARHQRNGTL